MFADAEEEGLIVRSPFRRLKAGGKKTKEKKPLTDAQVKALKAAVAGTAAEPFVLLGLDAGLRKEEILGLRWCNVHLEAPAYLDVQERVVFVQNQPLHEEELKSEAGRRRVPIPDELVHCLARQDRVGEFVICNRDGGPRSSSSFRRLWQIVTNRMIREGGEPGEKIQNHKIYRTLDFDVTPHLLRHTYITNLCRAGLNIKTIQYLAGHATAQMTLKYYIHATENQPEDLTDQINAAFSGTKKIQK
jgi:integrase